MNTTTSGTAVILEGFDDPRIPAMEWDALVDSMELPLVFMRKGFQKAWWDSYSPGKLLLVAVERGGRLVALAPMFESGGMGFLVGSGGSDYLDIIGDVREPTVIDALLDTARASIDGFIGFRFHHILESSSTGPALHDAASRLGLAIYDEGELAAPALSVDGNADALVAASAKKSLRRHENRLRREGHLSVRHLSDPAEISPLLPALFDQHVDRWRATEFPSLFEEQVHRDFYERLLPIGCAEGWLRFTVVELDLRPVAFHFGFSYRGRYLWYKPSFDISLAKWSPGEVLLRHLLLAAADEGTTLFDLGLGEEPFKARFSDHVSLVRTWGLYDAAVVEGDVQ